MARPIVAKDTIKRATIQQMKKLGTYLPEYEPLIDVYAEMREQYERLTREYASGKSYRYQIKTSDGGAKKSPLAATIEALRRDILQYSDRLMLNPKAMADRDAGKKESKISKLAEVLGHED